MLLQMPDSPAGAWGHTPSVPPAPTLGRGRHQLNHVGPGTHTGGLHSAPGSLLQPGTESFRALSLSLSRSPSRCVCVSVFL